MCKMIIQRVVKYVKTLIKMPNIEYKGSNYKFSVVPNLGQSKDKLISLKATHFCLSAISLFIFKGCVTPKHNHLKQL